MENFPAFADWILVLVFGVLLPFISGVRSAAAFKELKVEFDSATKRRFYLGNSFFLFIIAAVITILIALITVSYQSISAAIANPVKSLRYE